MSLVFVYGTRPEAIKLGPVVAELKALGITPIVISTGQHWDLLRGTPAETDLSDSVSLGLPANGDTMNWLGPAIPYIQEALPEHAIVVVQGDTASAFAGARAAQELDYPVVHIEAGIRSGNLQEPWPEEGFRREITQLATWHYAPTEHCVDNLLAEGIPEGQIRLTGNPVVSALQRYANASPKPSEGHILLTMHRREWLEQVDLAAFLQSLMEVTVAHGRTVIWPVHPNVKARWPKGWDMPMNPWILTPQPYERMVTMLSTAHGLATDSGGLVEEAATLGIPTAILRNSNDRPEAIDAGTARQFSPTDLETAFQWLTCDHGPRKPSWVFGSPTAANQIAKHLANLLD